jgi:hypothetical protein
LPRERPTVASFWVLRPDEHPEAEARNYPEMLRILDRSCRRFGMRHVVLTDLGTYRSPLWPQGLKAFISDLPRPLMQAFTSAQANWLELERERDEDTLLVGADCIFVGDPLRFYPEAPGLCVTYRNPLARYPINTGAQLVRRHSIDRVAPLYRRVADRCGTKWCDDQRALRAELEPMPLAHGTYERHGISVAFLPMARFNDLPRSVEDPKAGACMLHFRGKGRKGFLFDWAARHGYA